MKIEELKELVSREGESTTLEFKTSMAELDKLGQDLGSCLNTEGGIGLIGVTDKWKFVGIEVTDTTKKKMAAFRNNFDPKPNLKIEYVPIPDTNKYVIVVRLLEFDKDGTYLFKEKAYWRNESQREKMPIQEFKRRLRKSAGVAKLWEAALVDDYTIECLDHDEIRRTVKVGISEGRLPENINTDSIEDVLMGLDLMLNGKLTNAAMILFAKQIPTNLYPQTLLKMGRFTGDHSFNNIMDSRQIYGNAFQLLQEAQTFISKHMMIASRFKVDSYERIDEPTLPPLAIREAIINAICHRDYSDLGTDIQIAIFDDYLEIHNTGSLYGGVTIDQLNKRHFSRRRNERIANVFFVRKLIDRWGSGTQRIFELCAENGLPIPEFIEEFGGLTVRFFYKQALREVQKEVFAYKVVSDLLPRQTKIIEALTSLGSAHIQKLYETLSPDYSKRTLQLELQKLQEIGLLSYEGAGRLTTWKIAQDRARSRKIAQDRAGN